MALSKTRGVSEVQVSKKYFIWNPQIHLSLIPTDMTSEIIEISEIKEEIISQDKCNNIIPK